MYPGRHNTTDFVFVKHLVEAIASFGHHVYVICPYNFLHYRKYSPSIEVYSVGKGQVTVYRPWYLSMALWHIGSFYPSLWFRGKALNSALNKIPIPVAVYGHFWDSAYSGYEYSKKNNLPLFVASGESEIDFEYNKKTIDFCKYISGVICVSSKNKEESISLGLTSEKKCLVAPNAINNKLFKKITKSECRDKLGMPQDAFIIAFAGWFIERKGSKRVSQAISLINEGPRVYSIFIGEGTEEPDCPSILFKGKVQHDKMPIYLNAADVFVLPTLHEGCCNAIVEAMACGLPIISSDLSFNKDICDETNSILINPKDIEAIKNAIIQLRDKKDVRERLSKGSLKKAESLTIEKRAANIIDFIKEKSNYKN